MWSGEIVLELNELWREEKSQTAGFIWKAAERGGGDPSGSHSPCSDAKLCVPCLLCADLAHRIGFISALLLEGWYPTLWSDAGTVLLVLLLYFPFLFSFSFPFFGFG